jgi:Aerobic-type carbon monoxide dehydrogenase, large subunit CoxL/CutL homologs
MVAGLPEHKIRVISPDIGGGFGNKVPIYPGYLCAITGSMITGRPVKWMEDRSENLMSTCFARDFHMRGELAASRDGKIRAVRVTVLADHGAFNGAAQPTKYPAGFFGVFTGSYDLEAAHCQVTAVYTNKAPGGVAYSCSFRITEAVYLVERMVDVLAFELNIDPAELRMRNLLRPEQFPYTCQTGWTYDSGDYPVRCGWPWTWRATRTSGKNRRPNGPAVTSPESVSASSPRPSGRVPASTWTSWASAWPTGWNCASTRPGPRCSGSRCRPRGRGTRPRSRRSSPRSLASPRTTWRSCTGTPTRPRSAWVPTGPGPRRCPGRPPRSWPGRCASGPGSWPPPCSRSTRTTWSGRRPLVVKGDPDSGPTIAEIAWAAHSNLELPDGIEGQLDATCVYNPPNLTYPFGAYICVVDVDPGTGKVDVRRFIAVDDCGVRINPMIVEGQVHGGLADGIGMALMESIAFDADGNCLGGSFMDYLLPTSLECPSWELGATVTPSPHHPIGAKGVGESATVGSPPAVVNAVIDALRPYGVRHADMPLTPAQVWRAIQGRPFRTDLAIS